MYIAVIAVEFDFRKHRGRISVFYESVAFLTIAMLILVRRTIWFSEAPALRIRASVPSLRLSGMKT